MSGCGQEDDAVFISRFLDDRIKKFGERCDARVNYRLI